MQLDPMTPMLKPPGTKHLKLECKIRLSTFAFKFNLRRHTEARAAAAERRAAAAESKMTDMKAKHSAAEAGAYTLPLFSSS